MVISNQKNILALVGSNHIYGFTRNIIQLLKDNLHARNENIDFQIIDTTEIDINVCRGCNTCFEKGLCPLDRQDDMGQLKAMLDNADVIILACPVYLMHVSSPMKILFPAHPPYDSAKAVCPTQRSLRDLPHLHGTRAFLPAYCLPSCSAIAVNLMELL